MNHDRLYDPATIDLESSLGYLLARARNALVARTDEALKPLELSAQQIGVMRLLASGRAHTPYELSRELSYDSGSMTRMLDRLERKGFVARERSVSDRRIVELKLTQRGASAAVQIPAIVAQVLNEQLHGFTRAELELLTALLARFIANTPPGAAMRSKSCSDFDDQA
jgi:DNA-binding MarR family transcriptional regulator